MPRKVVVGFSGGITSAWCAGWALRTFPREEVALLWHDTKEEDEDTYRFKDEMAAALGMPITERSDGRSVTEVARDEGKLPNDISAFCSRILKQEQGNKYIRDLQEEGYDEIIRVIGYSAKEPSRVQFATALGWQQSSFFCNVYPRFPLIETKTTKQQCWDWCNCTMGVTPHECMSGAIMRTVRVVFVVVRNIGWLSKRICQRFLRGVRRWSLSLDLR